MSGLAPVAISTRATRLVFSPAAFADKTCTPTMSRSMSAQPGCCANTRAASKRILVIALRMSLRMALCWHSSKRCTDTAAATSAQPSKNRPGARPRRNNRSGTASLAPPKAASKPNIPTPKALSNTPAAASKRAAAPRGIHSAPLKAEAFADPGPRRKSATKMPESTTKTLHMAPPSSSTRSSWLPIACKALQQASDMRPT
mmetsp:Transcript_67883/g.196543  ORF Transcript_67883/g.196543 Transcript_67883/m.196543 type:complete len:201 (+) Transcript_67883:1058-1660(+)